MALNGVARFIIKSLELGYSARGFGRPGDEAVAVKFNVS